MAENMASVLVVDDILANRRIAGKILADEFVVDTVKSGEEALDFFTKKIPDLVLLDIYMEGIDGFEVLEAMRKNPATANIPVIFLTADDDHEVETRGFKSGAVDFITKPFIPAIMLERVRRVIEHYRLRDNLRKEVARQTERIQRLSLQLTQVLVNTIEKRNQSIKGHSARVADYAWEIAHRLGKPMEEQENIYYMGLLHAIGKIGVPDAIINKEDALTEAEEEIMQQTTVLGGEILKDVTELPNIWQGAKYHKENYDGSGYPDGLKGKAIPEAARIIAVACGYDVLTSKAKHLSQAEVRSQLEAESGRKYDPELAGIMLEIMDEDVEYLKREQ